MQISFTPVYHSEKCRRDRFIQPDQPECRLIEKNSNFYNFIILNQTSLKPVHYYLPIITTPGHHYCPCPPILPLTPILFRFFITYLETR